MKKTIVGGGVAAFLLAALIYGGDLWSVAKTGASNVREAVKAEHSPEFELQRARNMVKDLLPEIRSCMTMIAEQQVDVENLEASIEKRQTSLVEQQEILLKLTADLENEDQNFVYAGVSYSRAEVEKDRTRRWDIYQTAETALNRDVKILNARKMTLKANRDKLEGMLSAKQKLEVQIAEMEARLEAVKAAETVKGLEFDDSQLNQTRALIDEIEKKIKVREKLVDEDANFNELIPLEENSPKNQDLSTQIKNHFGTKHEEVKKSPGDLISTDKGTDSK